MAEPEHAFDRGFDDIARGKGTDRDKALLIEQLQERIAEQVGVFGREGVRTPVAYLWDDAVGRARERSEQTGEPESPSHEDVLGAMNTLRLGSGEITPSEALVKSAEAFTSAAAQLSTLQPEGTPLPPICFVNPKTLATSARNAA